MDPVSIGLSAASTLFSASGAKKQGKAAQAQAEYDAQQMEQQAQASRAEGTRVAYEDRRQGRIVESNARAAMAAGGGSASDAGSLEMLGKIGAESQYNSLVSLFKGESQAQDYNRQADTRRYEGALAKKNADDKALSTILSGASSIYSGFSGFGGGSKLYSSNLKTNRKYGWNSGVG